MRLETEKDKTDGLHPLGVLDLSTSSAACKTRAAAVNLLPRVYSRICHTVGMVHGSKLVEAISI